MLVKLNFPREAVLLAGFGQMLFNLLIQLALLAVLLVVLRVPLPSTAPLFFRRSVDAHHAWATASGSCSRRSDCSTPTYRRPSRRSRPSLCSSPPCCTPRRPKDGSRCSMSSTPSPPCWWPTRDWLLVGHTDFLLGFCRLLGLRGSSATVLGLILVRISMPFLIERMGS